MKNKKRLVIYVVYDFEGFIDKYIIYMIKSLQNLAKKIVLISNKKIKNKRCLDHLQIEIIERKNEGFDFGAFKYFFLSHHVNTNEYDEIILMNDTFYGPFFGWEEIFDKMETVDCDCWGLTYKKNNFKFKEIQYVDFYLQTYFLCFRKRIINDGLFINFWKKTRLPQNISDNVLLFEIGINKWLIDNNYRISAYLKEYADEKYYSNGKNPYGDYAYEIIKECRFPILKRHAMTIPYWAQTVLAMQYIDNYTSYDVDMIWDNWSRFYFRDDRCEPNIIEFKDFCNRYAKLHIYGNGAFGKRIKITLMAMGFLNFDVIVTKRENVVDKIKEIEEVDFGEEDGIIIAVNHFLHDEVVKMAQKYVNDAQIFVVTRMVDNCLKRL